MIAIQDRTCIFYLRNEDILEMIEDITRKEVDIKFKNSVSQEILRIDDITVTELHEILISGTYKFIKKRFRRMK